MQFALQLLPEPRSQLTDSTLAAHLLVLSLRVGKQVVELLLPGFARWKRDLTLSTGSDLTLNAYCRKCSRVGDGKTNFKRSLWQTPQEI
jgi:hypothetical protein